MNRREISRKGMPAMKYQKRLTNYMRDEDIDDDEKKAIAIPKVVKELPLRNIEHNAVYTFSKGRKKRRNNPLHAIHSYPAKFVPEIPRWGLEYASLSRGAKVLDPFAGCGTTLLEAVLKKHSAYGVEMHPLGRLISKVKTTPLEISASRSKEMVRKLHQEIDRDRNGIDLDDCQQQDINLHENWRYWFSDEKMEGLIRIKRCIRNLLEDSELAEIRDLMLVCLSSIIKPVSFLDENQIKVLRDQEKVDHGTPDPVKLFKSVSRKRLSQLISFTKDMANNPYRAKMVGDDARRPDMDSSTIDLVITSPPYLNAIDYPFAHKYELFILDLVVPDQYRPHSRSYIGVSERVIRKRTYGSKKYVNHRRIDELIDEIYTEHSNVDQKRAYILNQYFSSMRQVMSELFRVLKEGALLLLVVGEYNVIRGTPVPTADLVEDIAIEQGLSKKKHFYHRLHSRKLPPNRHDTGGLVKDERISIMQKV